MINQSKKQIFIIFFLLIVLTLQACLPAPNTQESMSDASPTMNDELILTATPLTPTTPPTATKTPISNTPTASPIPTQTPAPVIFSVSGGNQNIRRGPGLAYNYINVLYDGEAAVVVGRNRAGDWLLVELPSDPAITGWMTTETEYAVVEGEIKTLPLMEDVDPPDPAYLRNCTKHRILVLPADVELLNKYNEPDNQTHLNVLTYQLYDLDVAGMPRLEDVSLVEGKRVDIRYDGNGDKSKCE